MRSRALLPLVLAGLLTVPFTSSAAPQALPEAAGSAGMKLVAHLPGPGGTDLEFFSRKLTAYRDASGKVVRPRGGALRHFSVVGNESSNARIVDITAPERPFVASTIPCRLSQGDIQVNEARSIVVIANGTGSSSTACSFRDVATGDDKPMPPGSAVIDIKDVYAPKVVGSAPTPAGSHNHTLMPGGRYLYISTSEIVEGQAYLPIFDLIDPRRPKLVGSFTAPGNSPHDIRFNAKGNRAYTAGVSTFRILDTSNPVAPKLVTTFYPPGTSIGHDVLVTPDGAYLFAGDEGGGGATYPCPGGAIHTFDIRNEAAPLYLGQSYAGAGPVTNRDAEPTTEVGAPTSCTSHVMEIDPGRRSLTLGWYGAGSRVFSFASLYGADGKPTPGPAVAYGHDGAGLVESGWIRPQGGSTWSAKQYAAVPGYIFSDDLRLGFYVTRMPKR